MPCHAHGATLLLLFWVCELLEGIRVRKYLRCEGEARGDGAGVLHVGAVMPFPPAVSRTATQTSHSKRDTRSMMYRSGGTLRVRCSYYNLASWHLLLQVLFDVVSYEWRTKLASPWDSSLPDRGTCGALLACGDGVMKLPPKLAKPCSANCRMRWCCRYIVLEA